MVARWDAAEGIKVLVQRLNAEIAAQLAVLLQEKHLYQKVTIEAERTAAGVRDEVLAHEHEPFARRVKQALSWVLLSGQEEPDLGPFPQKSPMFFPKNVKLFCSNCDRREAFSPVWHTDALYQAERSRLPPGQIFRPNVSLQFYVLLYRCESCTAVLDAILIRREGWTFSIEGRSPIEHLEMPACIPEPERKWFRDALIGINAGKTLAALFYLRTFIEQFARRKTGKLTDKATGDDIMTEYAGTIPMAQRDHMPSLREWYDKLSAKIHGADEDAELFETARAEIEQHFEIRRVFKMDDPKFGKKVGSDNSATKETTNAPEA